MCTDGCLLWLYIYCVRDWTQKRQSMHSKWLSLVSIEKISFILPSEEVYKTHQAYIWHLMCLLLFFFRHFYFIYKSRNICWCDSSQCRSLHILRSALQHSVQIRQGMEKFFAVWEHKLRCKNFRRDSTHIGSCREDSKGSGLEAKALAGVQGRARKAPRF